MGDQADPLGALTAAWPIALLPPKRCLHRRLSNTATSEALDRRWSGRAPAPLGRSASAATTASGLFGGGRHGVAPRSPNLDSVAVICAAIAALIAGIGTAGFGSSLAWDAAAVAFAGMLTALLAAWNRSIGELQKALRPMFPTPPEAIDAPI